MDNFTDIVGLTIPYDNNTLILAYPETKQISVLGIFGNYFSSKFSSIIPPNFISYSSSDSSLVSVDSNGVVSTFSGESGTVTITVLFLGIEIPLFVTVASGIGAGKPIGLLGLTYAN